MKENKLDPVERGERLKRLRNLANLDRKELCDSCEVNVHTLKGWEIGRYGGLTQKGATKIITAVAKRGVSCSLDWLLYNIGAGPKVCTDYDLVTKIESVSAPLTTDSTSETIKIAAELAVFKAHYSNTTDFIIEDDGMLPHYQIGNYIAGTKRTGKNIEKLINSDCIVQTTSGQILFRRLRPGKKENSYSLMCTNTESTLVDPILYDVELASAASVIWHRKIEL